MGNPILTNMIMIGALVQTNVVNLSRPDIEGIIPETFSGDIAKTNVSAVIQGMDSVKNQ